MSLTLSRAEARRLLALYHFTPTDVPGVFERLSTVQYDPLNPAGRNPDLVLQARVPGYQVDDWQKTAYTDRMVYDAWDKMACLVPVSDWPKRARIRARWNSWSKSILTDETKAVEAALKELDTRGPLSTLEFEDQSHFADRSEWYGPKRIKHILRALWDRGVIVTHHRQGGRHYYDRAERVIPAEHFNAPLLEDEAEYTRWIMARRCQAMGLMSGGGDGSIWSGCGKAPQRIQALKTLVENGTITPVEIGANGKKGMAAYAFSSALPLLEQPLPAPRVIFLAPLDSLLWNRKLVMQLFDFDYTWEVYKPEPQRRWGYYVLPVFYGDRFVARLDSRLEGPRERPTGARMAEPGEARRPSPQGGGVWTISRWWWEEDVTPTPDLLEALRQGAQDFLHYLRADSVQVSPGIDPAVQQALRPLV